MPHHTDILLDATRTLKERTTQYGQPSDTYARAAVIASTVLQKSLTPYDIVMIMHAVKLSRIPSGHENLDNYKDGINYLAFAAEFAGAPSQPKIKPVPGQQEALNSLLRMRGRTMAQASNADMRRCAGQRAGRPRPARPRYRQGRLTMSDLRPAKTTSSSLDDEAQIVAMTRMLDRCVDINEPDVRWLFYKHWVTELPDYAKFDAEAARRQLCAVK